MDTEILLQMCEPCHNKKIASSSILLACTVVVLFFATLLWLQPKSTASALGNDTDQLSSLRFKEAVENNPFNVLASWNSSTHFCKWHGVTCSLNHQRVSALNLQGYALRGFITPEIGNLTLDASSTVKWSLSSGDVNATKVQNLKRELNALEAGFNDTTLSQDEVSLKKLLQDQLWNATYAFESFIKDRHILHGTMILNEVVEEAKRCKKLVLVLKVDFEKVYDSVSWSFLDYMLDRLGFCLRWRKGIIACLQSATISILGNVIVLKTMLRGFEMASGLKINFAKSHVGIFGDDTNWVHDAAQFLNCSHMETPFYYLAIPIGAKPSSCLVWEPLISKHEAKLSKWNQKILSMAGKVTLINSVLTALPIYLLSFFKIPQRVVLQLVSLQRNFLWGGSQELKKISWVKWDVICLPKEDGGLGIKDISKFNAALMGRRIWALSSNQNQLWARILTSKYGGWSNLSNGRDKVWHSQWWSDLQKLNQQPEFSSIHQQMVWKVRGGDKIKFWKDKWLGVDSNLQQQYNQLFLISGQQNSTISTMGSFSTE
ncbi:putative ribonuclease H protein [Glycine soja]|uniref:Putative ribonuclease H protein n=1 Tax=Glycine soja TaxID=3848 RepID=A0A445H4D6_GLYSO|nr:putative ribonuclease H protein [Glycine soja]